MHFQKILAENTSNRNIYHICKDYPGSIICFLGRGYTGHEHLTQFGLVNMNARLYNPAWGRFYRRNIIERKRENLKRIAGQARNDTYLWMKI
ncbi:MAG: hypothetical protein LBU22_07160 [Dysgonamonadaceae bacterium]|nr:hypothetical protein [Dysgonamonadaceae bacterium]